MREARIKSGSPDIAVRERLLSAATDLFSRKGYSATTTREIVDAAGVTKPVLYYYFRNKEGIYLELMRRAASEFEAVVNTYRTGPGSSTRKLLRLSNQLFDLFMKKVEAVRLIYSIYYGPPQGAPFFDFDAIYGRLHETFRQLVEEGIRSGEFQKDNPEDMAWTLVGTVHSAMEVELWHPERRRGKEGLKRALALIFHGISTHPVRRKGE